MRKLQPSFRGILKFIIMNTELCSTGHAYEGIPGPRREIGEIIRMLGEQNLGIDLERRISTNVEGFSLSFKLDQQTLKVVALTTDPTY